MEQSNLWIWFFAGGNFANGKINRFTGTFISRMREKYQDHFQVVQSIYHPWTFFNVIWALTWAQRPFRKPDKKPYMRSALKQIGGILVPGVFGARGELVLVGSSYGTTVAAQFACYYGHLIKANIKLQSEGQSNEYSDFHPFSVVLGTSLVSKNSELFKSLSKLQQDGIIRHLIYDELQDDGDNSNGLGGRSRAGAYLKALGIVFPYLTWKYKRPSFLNQHPVKGHIHRRRAQSVEKAEDFIREIERLSRGLG